MIASTASAMIVPGVSDTKTLTVTAQTPIAATTRAFARSYVIDVASTAIAGNAMPIGAKPATTPPVAANAARLTNAKDGDTERRELANQATQATPVAINQPAGTTRELSVTCSRPAAHTRAITPTMRNTAMPPASPPPRATRS